MGSIRRPEFEDRGISLTLLFSLIPAGNGKATEDSTSHFYTFTPGIGMWMHITFGFKNRMPGSNMEFRGLL